MPVIRGRIGRSPRARFVDQQERLWSRLNAVAVEAAFYRFWYADAESEIAGYDDEDLKDDDIYEEILLNMGSDDEDMRNSWPHAPWHVMEQAVQDVVSTVHIGN